MKAPPLPKFYDVPAGTRSSICSGESCGADIYWIITSNGKKMPVDCAVEGGHTPTAKLDPLQLDLVGEVTIERDGRGVSHFQTCTDADRFSGRGRK